MGEKLIKSYEISVWEDKLVQDGNEVKFVENKLAVIGSDTMTGLNKIYNPVFNKQSNGEKTLTFSLKYKYFDPYTGNDGIINPFAALLINERKVKLYYDNQWYEFVIKDHTESSEDYEWTYTCVDAFVLELSKTGYNITFDTELSNNQGTARELARETIKDTDWRIGEVNPGKQLIAEPIYKATLHPTNNLEIINVNEDTPIVFENDLDIYLFYSYVKNQNGKFIQFIVHDENREYVIDSKNVITDTNFRIKTQLEYKEIETGQIIQKGFWLNNNLIIEIQEIETRYQANRLAYNQRTTYDPVMQRTVDRYVAGDREIYKYVDSIYSTSDVLVNYITNGDNFNMLEDGDLQGWNPYIGGDGANIKKLELVTNPELTVSKRLANFEDLTEIEGFLKVQFNGALTKVDNDYRNAIYNSGFENNASLIGSVSKGEKFVFRWRAKKGTVDSMTPAPKLGAIVAKYRQDTPNAYSYYYKHIDENNIILRFESAASETPNVLNNKVKGGYIDWNTNNYYVDGIAQSISTKYIYVDSNNNDAEYVWDSQQKTFVAAAGNYLPYYYLEAEATKTVPNGILSDPSQKYGIFIYNTEGAGVYFIQDIQITRFIEDGENENYPILIGNVPTATSKLTEYYYIKPSNSTVKEDIVTYANLNALKTDLGILEEIIPLYNEDSEKVLTISASQSNCFNILQTIAETFECWIELDVKHDENGYILLDDDGLPQKYINLKEYIGQENQAGFKYGINLQSIEREVNSEEVVTKLIVDQAQSDYVDEGYVSITEASSNISGESYILNFDYYYGQGLLDREKVEEDRLNFITEIAEINKNLKDAETKRLNYSNSYTKLGSERNTYTELIDTAEDNRTLALENFQSLTSLTYEQYQQKQSQTILYQNNYYIQTTDTRVEENKTYYSKGAGNVFVPVELPDPEVVPNPNPYAYGWWEIFLDYTQQETLLEILGEIYLNSSIINSYSGLKTNIEQEYKKVKQDLYGNNNYNVKIWVDKDALQQRHVYVELNDYLPGYQIKIDGSTYESTVSKKFFDITTDATSIRLIAPSGYKTDGSSNKNYIINDNATVRFKIKNNETIEGIVDIIDDLLEEKNQLIKSFNNKYSRFIQEGTWNSTEYIDSELYYLDALQVSNTSAQPTISYTINVAEISQLEGLELYRFDAGDKSYVEDTEFFGWHIDNVGTAQEPKLIYTPAREEVIVSEVEWHLDEPDQNTITVQNYKTRFEDLFQRINAAVQTVQYNEATYAKTSTLLDANGTLNQNILLDSLNSLSNREYALTSNGSIIIDNDSMLVRNLTNPANRVIINSEGIRVSSDGGDSWTTVINGQGINVGAVYTGSLNTNEVVIGNKNNPSFRWDSNGISAYSFREVPINRAETEEVYDLQTFVRFDRNGLYGIKNNGDFTPQNVEDIKNKAHFAVTWDGFFIKNSYRGGGRVEITSNDDFRVLNIPTGSTDLQEKIKIGALEWLDENGDITINPTEGVGAPKKYGIRIKNDNGDNVFVTDDNGDIKITGTIEALGGNFKDLVTVGKNEDSQANPWIEIDGRSDIDGQPHKATIQSSNYLDTNGLGWMINADGDAVFNNITARGAIKTAVFEYAEIQAVGGIFIFRPSSTIKAVELAQNESDLIITVEKPLLFKDGDYCKVSNYTNEGIATDPDVIDIRLNNGLTYIYPIELIATDVSDESTAIIDEGEIDTSTVGLTTYQILLVGAAEMVIGEYAITTMNGLIGGALINMGNQANGVGKIGTSNYGIGINSSDNTVNLPARAISLFETKIDETQNPKVIYNYRGILGTLPQLSYGSDGQVNVIYEQNLKGKQGIYTDSIYIGDNDQFLIYYKDGNNKGHFKINASDISFGYDEEGKEIGLINKINLSEEGVQISGEKVNVEGAAIFTTGRLSENNVATKTDSINQTHRIYYQSDELLNPPVSPGNIWITSNEDNGEAYYLSLDTEVIEGKVYYSLIDDEYVEVVPIGTENPAEEDWYEYYVNYWTCKHMSYNPDKPYVWTCEQSRTGAGEINYTDILIDDTTTIIDGGRILANTVGANQIEALSIMVKHLNVGTHINFSYRKQLTDSEPIDWNTNWKNYYIKNESYEDEYDPVVSIDCPIWQSNMYYKDNDAEPQIIIGYKKDFAVTIDTTQITFWHDYEKVAFINGDKMEIPESIMLNEMRVGHDDDLETDLWSWKKHERNLCLKWIGG